MYSRRLTHLWAMIAALLFTGSAAGCVVTGRSIASTPAPLPPTPVATVVVAYTLSPPSVPTLRNPTPWPARPRPTATLRSTVDPATATPEPDIAATLVASVAPRLYASYPSPDGRQRAEIHIFDCVPFPDGGEYAYDRLQVVDTATGAARFIDGQLQACGGLGAFGLAGLFWSPSGRYFYYTEAREGVPDGCGYWSRPISRADTTGWTTADLGGGSLSPDGTRLAVWDERNLVVYDVDGGPIGRATAADPAAALGPVVWSPDGRSLAYVQAAMFCIPGQSGATSVVRVEVPALTSEVLFSSTSPAFQSVAWNAPIALDLVDDTGARWQYDFYSAELSPVP